MIYSYRRIPRTFSGSNFWRCLLESRGIQ